MLEIERSAAVKEQLLKMQAAVSAPIKSVLSAGKVIRVIGMRIDAVGLIVPLNTLCEIVISETKSIVAEAVSFSDDITYLLAAEYFEGIEPGSRVIPLLNERFAKTGDAVLGRILDATGKPLDELGSLIEPRLYPLFSAPINPISRHKITEPLDVGVRAINGLMTVGKGQRIGIFAGSGVGKSMLLGMMTRFAKADVVVVGLIGERGREVKEFIEDILGKEGLARAVIIAAPADTAPLMRVNGAVYATAIAEYFRDLGKDVLLIIDSLTRYAHAHREMALSTGELPATKGYAPSVFGKLSQLVERSGNGINSQGSITAFYTVLVDTDEMNDPIADHIRSILDGHIILSRQLAELGHYPAIDVEKSISRVMLSIVDPAWLDASNEFKRYYSVFMRNQDLLRMGMYQAGTDPLLDAAIAKMPQFENYLKQAVTEDAPLAESVAHLYNVTQVAP